MLLCQGLTKIQRKHKIIMYIPIVFPLLHVQFKNNYDLIYITTLCFIVLINNSLIVSFEILRIYMYMTRVNIVGGQEKCRLSPLSTLCQSFFKWRHYSYHQARQWWRLHATAFWVGFTCVTRLAFLSYFYIILASSQSLQVVILREWIAVLATGNNCRKTQLNLKLT